MPTLTINGQSYFSDSPPDTPLLWVIREELRLTGTKFGCGIAMCGACTVHINGQAVRSCSVMLGDVGNAAITTIEGLDPADAHPVQQAWIELQVPAVRVLPVGPDHAGLRAAGAEPRPRPTRRSSRA